MGIDLLLKIVDELLGLKRNKGLDRKERFKSVFEPTFNDLLLVHSDYVQMFEEVAWQLSNREREAAIDPLEKSLREQAEDRLDQKDEEKYRKIVESANRHGSSADPEEYKEAVAANRRTNISREVINKAKEDLRQNRLKYEPLRIKLQSVGPIEDYAKMPKEENAFVRSVIEYFPNPPGGIKTVTSSAFIFGALQVRSDYNAITYLIDETLVSHRLKWSDVCEKFAKLRIAIWT